MLILAAFMIFEAISFIFLFYWRVWEFSEHDWPEGIGMSMGFVALLIGIPVFISQICFILWGWPPTTVSDWDGIF